MERRWMTPQETVEYLGLKSLKALYGRIERKQIPCTRLGREVRFDRLRIDLFLERRAVRPNIARDRQDNNHNQ
jgi:excisionase family DNA binding protein